PVDRIDEGGAPVDAERLVQPWLVAIDTVVDHPVASGRVGGDRVVADADELVAVLVDDVRATDVRIKQALAGVVDERAERGPRPAGADRVTGGGSGAAVRRRPHEV